MDPSLVSRDLHEQAEGCLRDLDGLAGLAHKAHPIPRISSTGNLLTDVDEKTKKSSRLLETWMRNFASSRATGRLTTESEVVETTKGWFENLKHWIKKATTALKSRLMFRKLYLLGFIPSKRLAHRISSLT